MRDSHNAGNGIEQLSVQHLRALHAVLAAGNVTRAAKNLGISQSALSHQLSRLRELLNDPLTVRARGGVVPTPFAERLALPLASALRELERALAPSRPWDPASAHRRFRIGVADHYAPLIVAQVLPRIDRLAPGVDIDLRPLPPGDGTAALERGELDIVGGPVSRGQNALRSRPLFTSEFACAVHDAHPEVGETLDLETYCQLAHILITPGGSTSGPVDERLNILGRQRRVQVTVPYFLAAPMIVATTKLIVTGPRRLLKFMSSHVPLRVLDPPAELELPTAKWGLMWHERFQSDEAHKWFRSLLAELL